jgi:WD40 repeat protein
LWSAAGDSLTTFAHDEAVRIAAFSPDGKHILTAGKMIKIWDDRGQLMDSLSHKENVNAITFSPDEQQILSASVDHTARLWNFKGELLAEFDKHEFQVNVAVFSPDGKRILTASDDGYTIVWWTPRAIYEWISTAPVYRLSKLEEALYKIRE